MNMKYFSSLVIGSVLAIGLSGTVQAQGMGNMMSMHGNKSMMGQGGGMGMMGMHGGMGMMGMGMLDLSDSQKTKIRAIRKQLRQKRWDVMDAMEIEHDKLRKLYRADKRDPKKIGAVYKRIFDAKRRMIETSIEYGNRMQAVLTPDQRKQLKMMRSGMGRGKGMMGGQGMMGR